MLSLPVAVRVNFLTTPSAERVNIFTTHSAERVNIFTTHSAVPSRAETALESCGQGVYI